MVLDDYSELKQLALIHWVPVCCVQVEASSIRGGIGLVKVMGRHSGFLAMQVGANTAGRWGHST